MVILCCSLWCAGLSSRSSNSSAYRGQTGNWGQGKWTGLRGEVCYSASQWLLHFWNLRLQSPPSSTPNFIVYLLALAMDCTFFKDAVEASAGGPDRTCLRLGCGPWVPVCNLSGRLHCSPFLVWVPPTPALAPLLKLFLWPKMPSAISGCPNSIHPSESSSQSPSPNEASVTLALHFLHPLYVFYEPNHFLFYVKFIYSPAESPVEVSSVVT